MDNISDVDPGLFLAGSLFFITLFNIKKLTSVILEYLITPPGVGKLFTTINPKTKKKNVFVKTTIGKIRLPYYKLPSIDLDVYFFNNPDVITENTLISRDAFNELFKDDKFFPCNKYDLGIIPQFISPKDYRNGKRLSGFMSSFLEDSVFVFKIDDDIIDYEKLLSDYEKSLEGEIYKFPSTPEFSEDLFIVDKKED